MNAGRDAFAQVGQGAQGRRSIAGNLAGSLFGLFLYRAEDAVYAERWKRKYRIPSFLSTFKRFWNSIGIKTFIYFIRRKKCRFFYRIAYDL